MKKKDCNHRWYGKIRQRIKKIFKFQNLKGYDLTRIYGFLAERFLSYWFQKNAKCKTMNIAFYDIRNDIS